MPKRKAETDASLAASEAGATAKRGRKESEGAQSSSSSSSSSAGRSSSRAAAVKAKEGIKAVADYEASDALPAAASSSSAAASLSGAGGKKGSSSAGAGGNVVVVTESYKPNPELYTAPLPTRKADGTLVFKDVPEFCPNKTPEEVLRAGSFGGTYYRDIYSSVTKTHYKDMWKSVPGSWLTGLNIKKQVASQLYQERVNKYGVSCGQSLDAWESSGWITSWDPYGWFHWYCRFYQGRRCPDDERQIGRWKGIAGPTGRWKGNLAAKVVAARSTYDDPNVSPVVRQTLLHWGYELTAEDFAAFVKKMKGGGAACYSVPASAYSSSNINSALKKVEAAAEGDEKAKGKSKGKAAAGGKKAKKAEESDDSDDEEGAGSAGKNKKPSKK